MARIPKKELTEQPNYASISRIFQYIYEENGQPIPSHSHAIMNHIPAADIFSTSDDLIIEIELPGVRQEDIDISILRNRIVVNALKYECFSEKKVNFVCMERNFGRFIKTIDIPCPVNTTKIKAICRDGLLTIILPKIADNRGVPKKIVVES